MKFTKERLTNFILIIFLGIILFTPVGFHMRVFVSKIISFSPTELDVEDQVALSHYNWKLNDKEGNVFDFNDTKGKVVLVNFWATWCPPCVAEMPSLQELYDDYGDKIEFLLVAHDEKEKVQEFLLKQGYDFPIYFERDTTYEMFKSENIPTTYVINSTGKIVIEKTGAADWNSKKTRSFLDKLIKE